MQVFDVPIEDAFEDIVAALPAVTSSVGVKPAMRIGHPDIVTTLAEPSRGVGVINPADPARIGYPATLPIELALRIGSTRSICEEYGITRDEWELIRHHPAFLADLERAVEMVTREGMSFKLKAKLQAEELLKTSWRTIHDENTPPSVRADLIKATVRWAEYDNPKIDPSAVAAGGTQFAIQINFKNN
jgi:hypothetical protein